MNLVFLASLSGRKELEKDYLLIIRLCKKFGHQIYDDYVFKYTQEILGTNPVAAGIPTSHEPIILDMATSKVAMSLIWDALRENRKLPSDTFFDQNGQYTIDPHKAKSVEIFGGYKGFGLSLLVQILTGSLIGAKMGIDIKSHYDIGYFFQAIDPGLFQPVDDFKKQNDNLIQQIKKAKKKGVKKIRLPGEESESTMRQAIKKGSIAIPDTIWDTLMSLTKRTL